MNAYEHEWGMEDTKTHWPRKDAKVTQGNSNRADDESEDEND
ncbi:MAG: hypothetical protein JWQ71_66 [Pedosphaera sp.]|nr:hypothetical protein [Pedosphaera sp.]